MYSDQAHRRQWSAAELPSECSALLCNFCVLNIDSKGVFEFIYVFFKSLGDQLSSFFCIEISVRA